jgi:restriction system protein
MASKYKYYQTITHNGLNKRKTIYANSKKELKREIMIQNCKWEEQYQKKKDAEVKRLDAALRKKIRLQDAINAENCKKLAEQQTLEAQKVQESLEHILINSLHPSLYDFEEMKDYSKYAIPCPLVPNYPKEYPEPQLTDKEFNPKPGILEKLSKNRMEEFNKKILKNLNWLICSGKNLKMKEKKK